MSSQLGQASELIEGDFESGGHQFHYEGLSNMKYPFLKLQKKPLLLVTHSSIYWDGDHRTWRGTGALVAAFRANNFPVKYLAVIEERSPRVSPELKAQGLYFPPGILAADLYPFQGDSHRIITTGTHVVIAGGNFTICACSTVRSVIALSESPQALNIHYAMDAIYEGEKGVFSTLQEISERMDDPQFFKYLRDQYFNADALPCHQASLKTLNRKFNYDIFRGGRLIGRYGKGATHVILHFRSSAETLNDLDLP